MSTQIKLYTQENISQANWKWPFFTRDEFKCKDAAGECRMDPQFMNLLVALRTAYNKPLIVASGYRSPNYNASVSTTGLEGPHTFGRAVDILIGGFEAEELLHLVHTKFYYNQIPMGFTGKGIKQLSGSKIKFLHLDNIPENALGFSRPITWSY